jgi:hypothetical protein
MSNLKSLSVRFGLAAMLGFALLSAHMSDASAHKIKGHWGKAKIAASCDRAGGMAYNVSGKGNGSKVYGCAHPGTGGEVRCVGGKCEGFPPPKRPRPK